MTSLLRPSPLTARPQRVVVKLFCVLCDAVYEKPKSWYAHVKETHFPGQRSAAISRWLQSFLKSQWDPFRASSLPATIRSYADCIVCRNFRSVGHKVSAQSSRFQKAQDSLEDHLRSHLCYHSFSCLICRTFASPGSASSYADTVVELSSSTEGRYFTIHPAQRSVTDLKRTVKSVRRHIRDQHLICTTRTAGRKIVVLKSCIGFSPIQKLENLVHSAVQLHKRNLIAIRAVKKNNHTAEAVCQLKSRRHTAGVVDKIPQIRMQPDKSYFTISREVDEMLNDINEVLAEQREDWRPPDDMALVPSGQSDQSVSPSFRHSPSSSDSSSSPVMSAASGSSCSVSLIESDNEYDPESQTSAAATPKRRIMRRKQPVLSNQLRSDSTVSSYRPLPRRMTRHTVRQLDFDAGPRATRRPRRMGIRDEIHNAIPFLQSVNPHAPGVVDYEEPEVMPFSLPYDQETQNRVDQIILSFVDGAPELKYLSGQTVFDVLTGLSDTGSQSDDSVSE